MEFRQSSKLNEVCYEIRPVIEHANALEEAGHSVLRLTRATPRSSASRRARRSSRHDPDAAAGPWLLPDSRGVLSARRAVAQRYQSMGLTEVGVDDVFLGNGSPS